MRLPSERSVCCPYASCLGVQHPQRAALDRSAVDKSEEAHATAASGSPEATEPSKRATIVAAATVDAAAAPSVAAAAPSVAAAAPVDAAAPVVAAAAPLTHRMRARGTLTAPDFFHPDEPLRDNVTGSRRVRRPVSAIREIANARAQSKEEQARLEEDRAQLEAQRTEFNQILSDLGPALTAAATQQAEVERVSIEGGIQTRSNTTRSNKLDGGHRRGLEADVGDLTSVLRAMEQQGVGQVEVDHEAPPPRQPTLLEQMQVLWPAAFDCCHSPRAPPACASPLRLPLPPLRSTRS